jgi:diguanylate cyclase (GGDEF)-like protein/PAS domain S-box-containing protein
MATTSPFGSAIPVEAVLHESGNGSVELARALGETLRSVLPGLAGAFLLQALIVLATHRDGTYVLEMVVLNVLVAGIVWMGSLEAEKSSIPVTVENVAVAMAALTIAIEVLHIWLLHDISFTAPLIAAQYTAALLLWRPVLLWPVLVGSSVAWSIVVVSQHSLLDWVPLAVAMLAVCWKAVGRDRLLEVSVQLGAAELEAQERRQEAEERAALIERERRERHAIHAATDGHWYWDLSVDKCYFSPGWAAMLGLEPEEVGDRPDEFFNRIHAHYLPQVKEDLSAHIYGKLPRLQCQFRMQRRDGNYIWALLRGAVERDQADNPIVVSGSLVDVTHLIQAEKSLLDDAFQDRLTGLPNRKAFMIRLKRAVDQMHHEPTLFAVIFFDLDRFKIINDSYGHLIGDQLLAAAASRLRACLRQRTGDIIARFGGDEFVALLEDIRTAEDALVIANRFRHALRSPFKIGAHEILTGGSIGIAFSHSRIDQPEDLLRHADTAMYRAKAQGKGEIQVFNAEMHAEATRAYSLENDLGRALSRDEFFLEYQPVISVESGDIVGAEALVRWQRSTDEVISPGEFIALAEETGNIETIGEWVLRQAVEQNARWQRLGLPPIRIAVNVSAKQLRSSDFPALVVKVLEESRLQAPWLELELTETALMANLDEAATAIESLRKAGIRISIDDFGTGYSSLGYLRRFSFTSLKMDRSFVADLTANAKSLAVAQGLISLAHNLQLKVTAEGVETQAQLEVLRQHACDQFQGYLSSRPVRAEVFRDLLERRAESRAGRVGRETNVGGVHPHVEEAGRR